MKSFISKVGNFFKSLHNKWTSFTQKIPTPKFIQKIQNSEYSYIFDYYEYSREYSAAKASINPESLLARSDNAVYRTGIYVPEGYVLPLGDNRDNSQDGRYFGPVDEKKVNGRVVARFWPLGRIGLMTES